MAATVRVSYASSTGPTLTNAETGAKYNKEESLAGATTPVTKPNANGTAYSFHKPFCLEVTSADTTTISNRRYRMSAAPSAGLTLWFRDDGTTYQRGNAALTDNGTTNDAAPTGFGAAATSDTAYDTASIAAGLGRNGDYFSIACGVSNLFLGGAGAATALPSLIVTYDES